MKKNKKDKDVIIWAFQLLGIFIHLTVMPFRLAMTEKFIALGYK